MIPSDNLRPLFIEFARVNGLFSRVGEDETPQNIAYVLPTYEVRSEVRLPYTKKELQGKNSNLKSLIKTVITGQSTSVEYRFDGDFKRRDYKIIDLS